jgi:hypothetical protein
MRSAAFVLIPALLLAGCAMPSSGVDDAATPLTQTSVLVESDVVLAPTTEYAARVPYSLPRNASSGVIRVELSGTAMSVSFTAPEECESKVVAPGPTGRAITTLYCGALQAEDGELVLRSSVGTTQGRVTFAVTYLH